MFAGINRHGRAQTCLCVTARRQDILATHGYENTAWYFQHSFVFFYGKKIAWL